MIVYILVVLVCGLAYYGLLRKYARLWDEIEEPLSMHDERDLPQVSIVVPFRNEAGNLSNLLSCFNTLEYEGAMEVLLVNDYSTDNWEVELAKANKGLALKILHLENSTGKKAALELAWQIAQGDIILQTDADCTMSSDWLSAMVEPFADSAINLVSGPVTFSNPKSFFDRIVHLDFAALIAIGAAHIQWKKPLMCNGANMAYRKSAVSDIRFEQGKASGDDVYLLQKIAGEEMGAYFCKAKNAIVSTKAPQSLSEFWHQRIRWASKNGEYSNATNKRILIGVWLYNVLILGSLLSFSAIGVTGGLFLILLKILAEDTFYGSFSDFFEFENWFKTILFGQPFHILYMVILPPLSQVLKYKWKERKLR